MKYKNEACNASAGHIRQVKPQFSICVQTEIN